MFWGPQSKPLLPSTSWIAFFLLVPLGFNFFNVRRYGEIEFWLTSVKVALFTGLIILGVLLPMSASPTPPLLGTVNGTVPVECSDSLVECLSNPGFKCKYKFKRFSQR
jgi:amino acid permease